MITEAADAFVIHKYWSRETSARVIFFTKEQGMVRCHYKGGRSPKKQALLQSFLPLWVNIATRGDAFFVQTLELSSSPIALSGKTLFAGLYLNELLQYVLQPHDPQEILYMAYVTALNALAITTVSLQIEAILRRFEWVLLTACGQQISLTHEARSNLPLALDTHYRFVVGEGLVASPDGFLGAHLLAMANNSLDSQEVLWVAKRLMRMAIDDLLDGKVIKTRSLYRVLSNQGVQ